MSLATVRGARAALLVVAFVGCSDASTQPAAPVGSTGGGSASAYVVTGRVTDAAGRPIAGAEVVANNQLLVAANVVGRSDADGRYRLQLPEIPATWAMSASLLRSYDGNAYRLVLEPSDASTFAGNRGAARDFTWRVQGPRPDGGFYGSPVIAYHDPENYDLVMEDVELTLTPVGPIIDGSAGRTIVQRLRATADGDAVVDVPLGRYTIAAREAASGRPPRALQIRRRNTGSYASTLTTSFAAPYGTNLDVQQIVVEVRR
ncbi:hypothetical protein J421_0901 [Gemmatirosa kalamazoonensis]|uniref:Carboxypeptidase regulatory-like domain-containing protein n=1 Tax=Gemmatirosa kalamazoonensis TaxID=861299 RepID=W0RGB6_9BACT|nr:carboxypeptidase-like regulatory domain-containing protein [Gemmatirosa kalamazoonensis]AHG88438.1 hypothetical protein J421_0901 [Gemmatirosa kalamazoonensis]